MFACITRLGPVTMYGTRSIVLNNVNDSFAARLAPDLYTTVPL